MLDRYKSHVTKIYYITGSGHLYSGQQPMVMDINVYVNKYKLIMPQYVLNGRRDQLQNNDLTKEQLG